jgi:rare lipoprotein A
VGIVLVAVNVVSAHADGARIFSGVASHYGKNYRGLTVAGDTYDPAKFNAAHRTLPFGTRLHVTDPVTRRSVTVVVNDCGPLVEGGCA